MTTESTISKQSFNMPNFDPTAPIFLANPYPFYDALRRVNRVQWISSMSHQGWFVTGYDEAVSILRDQRFQTRVPISQSSPNEMLWKIFNHTLLYQNPPNHTRLRALVGRVFTSRVINDFRPYIQETIDYLLDSVESKGEMDVVSDLAFPLPSIVIARMLGVPAEDRDQFRDWSNTLIQTIDLARPEEAMALGNQAVMELIVYVKKLIDERRAKPQDDLISHLLVEGENGDQLSEDELVATCILMLIAGHETTVNLISNTMLALLEHPTELAKLQDDPTLIKSAVEEVLRYDGPTQMTARTAAEDVQLGECKIEKGQHVYILLGAANRDPAKFVNPNTFDMTRSPNPHIAFGNGIHFCIGASLARLEAQLAVSSLIKRFSHIELKTTNLQWRPLMGFRALNELKVSF
ncbi:cytochrome P450 [Bacillus sp. CGMCC 1.16541]|uniref:cytochrome P450 n=1 Tax=Bacillus sp. CGMCC 1.16541 TaxID=2185143 RepID=UPI0023B860D0|nr:cytochrome P450 [Bacillus sp. CGMCC 1.16541]